MRRKKDIPWYFIHDDVKYGPMDDDALCTSAETGLLIPDDVVWRDGMDDTVLARDIEGLWDDIPDDNFDSSSSASEDSQGSDTFDSAELTSGLLSFQLGHSGSGDITCPYCWYFFEPEDVLYIAQHGSLMGDPILGANEYQRFLPSRFTPEGHALDSEGLVCPDIACPRCHMRLPNSIQNLLPLFLSLVGAPGSGKSYFLASMCWKLRTLLPEHFMVHFTDADNTANAWLSEYEESLFVQHDDESYQSIRKTELRGDLYQQADFGGMVVNLPKPSIFSLRSDNASVFHVEEGGVQRNLILYDNAGEHFQPGQDTVVDPGTQHLIHSAAIMALFDPTKSPRFRAQLKGFSEDIQLQKEGVVQRQDTLFTETINRIRLHLGLDGAESYSKPVIVLVSKADVLGRLVEDILDQSPYRWFREIDSYALDLSRIFEVSYTIRHLLGKYAPEVIRAVESFASEVIYMPVSALGCSPIPHPDFADDPLHAPLVVKPGDISPKWVEVPLLYALYCLGYVCGIKRDPDQYQNPEDAVLRGDMLHFNLNGSDSRLRIPKSYSGFVLTDPDTGVQFKVPELED